MSKLARHFSIYKHWFVQYLCANLEFNFSVTLIQFFVDTDISKLCDLIPFDIERLKQNKIEFILFCGKLTGIIIKPQDCLMMFSQIALFNSSYEGAQ